MWTLANGLEDAFIVWLLCQKRDREYHNNIPSGYIKDTGIFKYLSHSMEISKKKAQRCLERAVQYGFLSPADKSGTYYICSQRRLVFRAMDNQQHRHDEDNRLMPSHIYLKGDKEFTRLFEHWVCPNDMAKTKALLYGVMAIQGTPFCRGRDNHGRLIGHNRRTVQRYSEQADVQAYEKFLIFDVIKMLIDPACSVNDAVIAFQEAESVYRGLGKASIGRKLFHRKSMRLLTNDLKAFLTIQLPNSYSSRLDLKTVPSHQGSMWLNSALGGTGCNNIHVDSRHALVSGLLRGNPSGRGSVPVTVPDRVMTLYTKCLSDILEVDECVDAILQTTGARGLRPIRSARPQAWQSCKPMRSSTTPFLAIL